MTETLYLGVPNTSLLLLPYTHRHHNPSHCCVHDMYTGKSQKKRINQPDNGFDIATAMKTRRPLRKTSTAMNLLEGQYQLRQ